MSVVAALFGALAGAIGTVLIVVTFVPRVPAPALFGFGVALVWSGVALFVIARDEDL